MRQWVPLTCLLLQACMSAAPALGAGGLTPAGRTDVALGGASSWPTVPRSIAQREDPSAASNVVPHLVLRHGMRAFDDADWRSAPADLDLTLVIMPGYGVGAARFALWEDRGSTSRYALLGGLSLEGGVFGDQARDLQPAFGVRVPFALTASIGSVVEGWLGAQAIAVYVADSEASSIFGASVFCGLAAGLRNFHGLFEIQGGPLSPEWFSGPWRWHWAPSFSLRYRM